MQIQMYAQFNFCPEIKKSTTQEIFMTRKQSPATAVTHLVMVIFGVFYPLPYVRTP